MVPRVLEFMSIKEQTFFFFNSAIFIIGPDSCPTVFLEIIKIGGVNVFSN